MFDCGNSRSRRIKKENCYSSAASATSAEYNHSSNLISKNISRRCIEGNNICRLIDEMRYSGRDCLVDHQRSNKIRESSRCSKSNVSLLRLDGGTSITQYAEGPMLDLGRSTSNNDSVCN